MDAQQKADEYIGHEAEVDEGLEVYMRRKAYKTGYEDAVRDIKLKVEAWRDNYIRQLEVRPRPNNAVFLITGKLEATIMILEDLKDE